MKSPSVSIIMPVYNTEKYLEEAINSVLRQSLADWELILVNDGSTDSSLQILKSFAEKDSRIFLLDQPNAGVSKARNYGLSIAQGKYVYFLDSDDEIVDDALKICYENCESLALDFLFFDAESKYDLGAVATSHSLNYSRQLTSPFEVLDGVSMIRKLLSVDEFLASPCLIFTNRSFIQERNLSFLEGIVHEDELFTTSLFLLSSRTIYLPERLFVRRIRANSIMTKPVSIYNIRSYFTVASSLKKLVLSSPSSVEAVDLYLEKLLNAVLWKAHSLPIQDRLEVFQVSAKNWSSYITMRTWLVLLFKKYLPKR